MAGGGVAEKRPGGGDAGDASGDVHESIEAKATTPHHAAMEEDADGEADADGEEDADGDEDADGEADPDMDADGDDDVEMTDAAIEVVPGGSDDSKQAQAAAFRAKRDLLHLIETTAHYLSSYEEDGIEIAGGFQRIPNKRVIPDYFDVIKEPTAFSTIRGRVQKRVYTQFSQFVRDAALICHNAQVYNRPSAPIFQYAIKLRAVLKDKLQQLVKDGSIQPKDAELPYLGEIPDFSPSPPAEEDEGDEEDEDEDDEDEESDSDSDDVDSETGRRRRRRSGAAARNNRAKQNGGAMSSNMYTATEGRINAVLAGLQKAKDQDGDPLLDPFETLPDREQLPDYYEEIKNPIAIDIIKRKSRRKIYLTIDDAVADLDLMFSNAKLYNQDGSEIFEAAVKLQALARRLASQERAKPDNAFRDEHGRLAVPGVQHLGQVWRIGDWILLRNANDPGKPIVAQIFRMWFDAAGHAWVNACWYYRPEQTVHRFDRHFYENEVIKTEQYRDHLFEDVLDRTFVMFSELYARGRPRGYPPTKTLYVCEYRYSEDKFRFTKIAKWEPCIPEEVRGLDIMMDLYPAPRRFPKYPSPIKHLLDANARESDALPKPTWGNPNAPPMIGSVHRRPRLPNESPPPDPASLPPPPQVLTSDMHLDPSRRVSIPGATQSYLQPGAVPGGVVPAAHPGQSPSPHASYSQQQFVPRPRGMPMAPGTPGGPGGPGGVPPNAHIQPSPHHHPMQAIAAHPPVPPQGQHGGHLAPAQGPGGPMPGGSPHLLPHNNYNNAPPHQQQAQHQQQQLRQGPPTPVQHNQMTVPPPQQQPQHHLSPQPHHPGMPPAAAGYNQHFPPQQQPHQQHQQHHAPPQQQQLLPQQQQQQQQQQQHRMPPAPMQTPTPVRQTPIMPPVPPHHHQQQQTIAPPPVPNGYIPPRATAEAFVLPEAVDRTIPSELRKHYHRDSKGRVLFFTTPSVGHGPSAEQTGGQAADNVRVASEYAGLGHSVRYLNGLEQFREERRLKRKARDEQLAADRLEAAAQQEVEREAAAAQLYNAAGEALGEFVQWMNDGTRLMFEGSEEGGRDKKKQATGTPLAAAGLN